MKIKKYKISISKKLTLIYSSILLAILISFAIVIFYSLSNFVIKQNEKELATSADTIVNYIDGSQSLDANALNNITTNQGIFFSIFDSTYNKIYSTRPDKSGEGYKKHFKEKESIEERKEKGFGHEKGILVTTRDININGKRYVLEVNKEFEDIGAETGALKEILIITSILGIIVCFISGSFLTKKLLKPIKEITQVAKDITSNSLDKRITTNGAEDELKELSDTFNSMIERLQEDFEKQKRFVSDASHELRTPLSVISGHVNMLSRWGKNDEKVLEESLETLKAEAENMNKLISNLLYLAKSDNNVITLNKEKFQLISLLKDIAEETMLTYNNIQVSYECSQELIILADYNSIKQLIRILVDNSVKFSNAVGSITLSAKESNNKFIISVKDNGIGIPKENLTHIFDRFYRVDESRTKATGGSGLGLSIAKRIVDSYGGSIKAVSEVGKGTEIIFSIQNY